MVSPMATIVSIGARLARLTFSPDILLTDGEARLLADTPAIGAAGAIEGWMPFGRVFETLAWGRRHVVMGANQIDRYGNQNISAFGPLQHPTRQMFGVRGAPGNTDQPRHQLLGRQPLHAGVRATRSTSSPASVGTRSIPTTRHTGSSTCYRVVSNLGVFDFNGPDHTMRRGVAAPRRRAPSRSRENTVVRGARAGRGRRDPARRPRRAAS